MIKNEERIFVECLREYCAANGISLTSYSHDWIFHLTKGDKQHVVYGYDLGVNSSSSAQICSDKAATFDVLDSHRVTSVPHHLFLDHWRRQHVSQDGYWGDLLRLHTFYGGNTVIKQNDGTGGRNVYLAQDIGTLESAVEDIFSKGRSVALSPFLEVEREVRFYILADEPVLCYEKLRPQVIGDGRNSVVALAVKADLDFSQASSADVDWQYVPNDGEVVPLTWKHNLGGGAAMLRRRHEELPDATKLASLAFQVLGLSAASVDVVCVDGGWSVLEVNTGLMIENAYNSGSISRDEAQSIYNQVMAIMAL